MSRKRKIEEVSHVEEERPTKRSGKLDVKSALDPTYSFADLPQEIIDRHILKFFDFRDWLRLVIVCKQWQTAARQSLLPKQFVVYPQSIDEETACSILSKYTIQTLVMAGDFPSTLLAKLLNVSTSVKTLVTDPGYCHLGTPFQRTFDHVHTLSTKNLMLLKSFPNVTRLKISLDNNWDSLFVDAPDEIHLYPCVKELEVFTQRTDLEYFEEVKAAFPSLTKFYVITDLDRDWPTLEVIGHRIGVPIICRNPHLLNGALFNMTVLSYHEYFNSLAETPLQNFLAYGEIDLCQQMLGQYTNKQYEMDFLRREPQFTFPLRAVELNLLVHDSSKDHMDKQMIMAMVDSKYIDGWRALGHKYVVWDKEEALNVLQAFRDGTNCEPITSKAAKAISRILATISDCTLSDIMEVIGIESFKAIASTRSRRGNTLLHTYAKKNKFIEENCTLLVLHCDINALNDDNQNAATIAFNLSHFKTWHCCTSNGAVVQSHLYSERESARLLEEMISSHVLRQALASFDRPYLQQLLWLLADIKLVDWRGHEELKTLVSLDKLNKAGHTRLTEAITRRYCLVVAALAAAGANVDLAVGPLRQTPLMLALDGGHQETICELVRYKTVDIKVRDKAKRSFVYYILKNESCTFLRDFLHYCNQRDRSMASLESYNTPENISFIKHEVNNVLTTPELSHFKTRLMRIALTSIELITFLIDVLGVDVNIEDQNGDILLTMITVNTRLEVVEFLLSRGANVNHQNKQRNTALMMATEAPNFYYCDRQSIQKALIDAGASLVISNMWGIAPVEADPNLHQFTNEKVAKNSNSESS